jgi:hypothetical protein
MTAVSPAPLHLYADLAFAGNGLDAVQDQIENNLLD